MLKSLCPPVTLSRRFALSVSLSLSGLVVSFFCLCGSMSLTALGSLSPPQCLQGCQVQGAMTLTVDCIKTREPRAGQDGTDNIIIALPRRQVQSVEAGSGSNDIERREPRMSKDGSHDLSPPIGGSGKVLRNSVACSDTRAEARMLQKS